MATSSSIAEKRNVRCGSNGFYDVRLRRTGDKAMLIEVALSVFFRFIPNGFDPSVAWSQEERAHFVNEWVRQIPATWDQQNYTKYRGFNISVEFHCNIREEAAGTQWQGNVMKLRSRKAFRTSSVFLNGYDDDYDCKFDSNDDLEKPGGRRQTAMIHEFGHMLGLPDEYKSTSPHKDDKSSVMNVGAELRARHIVHFLTWAKPHIDRVAGGSNVQSEEVSQMMILRRIAEATTREDEIAAAEAWRDGEGAEDGVHFVVRRRGTEEEISMEEISFDDFENLEIEFSSTDEEGGEVFVWEPKSGDALEIFFVE